MLNFIKTKSQTQPALGYLDKQLFNVLLTVALPITLQTIMLTSKSVVDVIMLGQLSELDVAGAGIATRLLFVFTIILSGIATGGATLAAQHFGAKNDRGIKPRSLRYLVALVFCSTSHSIASLSSVYLVFQHLAPQALQ